MKYDFGNPPFVKREYLNLLILNFIINQSEIWKNLRILSMENG